MVEYADVHDACVEIDTAADGPAVGRTKQRKCAQLRDIETQRFINLAPIVSIRMEGGDADEVKLSSVL